MVRSATSIAGGYCWWYCTHVLLLLLLLLPLAV
jgi:hypothetical protein